MHARNHDIAGPQTMADAHRMIEGSTREISSPSLVSDPRMSVCLITYNQRPFIRQALDGALAQQTDFPFEIIVGDDHSDDGTTDVVGKYQRAHPDKIRLLLADENLGRHTGNGRLNFIRTLYACRGEYVALLEGDDYWTAPHKLQQQAAALDAHPEWALCFHSTRYFWEDGSREPLNFPEEFDRPVSTVAHLIERNFMQTCSVVVRNRPFGEFPDWFLQVGLGDWPLYILTAQHGDIGYLPEVMADYRVHAGGFWTAKGVTACEDITTQFYVLLHRHLPDPLKRLAGERIATRYSELQGRRDHLENLCREQTHAIETLEDERDALEARRQDLWRQHEDLQRAHAELTQRYQQTWSVRLHCKYQAARQKLQRVIRQPTLVGPWLWNQLRRS